MNQNCAGGHRFTFIAQLIGHFKLNHQVLMRPRRQGWLRRSVLRYMARLALSRIPVLRPIEKLLGPRIVHPPHPRKIVPIEWTFFR